MRQLYFILLFGFWVFFPKIQAQNIIGISTKYDNRFDQWIIVTDSSDFTGTIEATWASLDDYTEWQYTLGDQSGIIRMRHKDNPNVWEVLGGGTIIQARTVFPGELGHWQMQSGRYSVDVEMFRRDPEQWLAKYKKQEIFFYTYTERDLRDWVVENKASFSLPMQLGLIFIPILQVIF
ncbi:hypothetical protein KUV50_03690 [Membranicola marinus]|uniref:Uncharacterized protein n=1 Tax=Membranihabitans marinus TaxID=1227546 RepID=A0A953LBZ5_9BACT|nr:hypothetical protein [Membranihabitans marinus]MBY5957224.1 hypothetical protein [Membranihabitans marinus]